MVEKEQARFSTLDRNLRAQIISQILHARQCMVESMGHILHARQCLVESQPKNCMPFGA
jgi:hypothetical protein